MEINKKNFAFAEGKKNGKDFTSLKVQSAF